MEIAAVHGRSAGIVPPPGPNAAAVTNRDDVTDRSSKPKFFSRTTTTPTTTFPSVSLAHARRRQAGHGARPCAHAPPRPDIRFAPQPRPPFLLFVACFNFKNAKFFLGSWKIESSCRHPGGVLLWGAGAVMARCARTPPGTHTPCADLARARPATPLGVVGSDVCSELRERARMRARAQHQWRRPCPTRSSSSSLSLLLLLLLLLLFFFLFLYNVIYFVVIFAPRSAYLFRARPHARSRKLTCGSLPAPCLPALRIRSFIHDFAASLN